MNFTVGELREMEKALRSRLKVIEAAISITKGPEQTKNRRRKQDASFALMKIAKQRENQEGMTA